MALTAFRLTADSPPKVLDSLDARATPGWKGGQGKARAETDALRDSLVGLQERLYAGAAHSLLVVLQAMDTGGKDGAIRRVFSGVNPAGVRIARFQAPTRIELARDYLWRVHAKVPEKGEIVIFNRSHYEDVLAARVNEIVPPEVWRRRYGHIRDFERMLHDEGTSIIKFYLHIDRDEQRRRLQDRLDEPDKRWKFDAHDLEQRRLWPEYMHAFRDAIVETDCDHAPWYVIPANRKWYRDFAIMRIVVDTLESLDLKYPKAEFDPSRVRVE